MAGVAKAAGFGYDGGERLDDVRLDAVDAAARERVEVADVRVDGVAVIVTVSRRTPTLLLHRISEDLTTPSVDGRARWRD